MTFDELREMPHLILVKDGDQYRFTFKSTELEMAEMLAMFLNENNVFINSVISALESIRAFNDNGEEE